MFHRNAESITQTGAHTINRNKQKEIEYKMYKVGEKIKLLSEVFIGRINVNEGYK